MDPTLDRWLDALKVFATTAVLGVALAALDGPAAAVPVVVVGIVGAWLFSPWSRGLPHTPHAAAAGAAGPDGLVLYWRPGCSVAVGLIARLPRTTRRRLTWVNVVREHDAAEFVRSLRGGDMVTPTVVTAGGAPVEPSPAAIRAALDPLVD